MTNKKIKIVIGSLLALLGITFLVSYSPTSDHTAVMNLKDKKIVFFGDSITQNFENEKMSYPDIVGSITQAETVNLGFGGTSMSIHPNKSFDNFAFHSLVDAIVNNDFSNQKAVLDDPEIPNYFPEKITTLENIDWNEVDVLTIMYGSNDWGKPLDDEENPKDVNTFMGAGRSSVEKLLTTYPHLEILFIPTIYRFWPDFNNVDSDTSVNNLGIRPYEYSDAMEELAKEFKFPYTDTLHGLGINKYNRHLYFNGIDGTHPNKLGTEKIAEMVAKKLMLHD